MTFYSKALPYLAEATAYYVALAELPCSAWLDSGGMARFDILTAAPHHWLLPDEAVQADPFAVLREELGAPRAPVEHVPFAGGALGYWGYDLLHAGLSAQAGLPAANQEAVPGMAIGLYDWALVLDHQEKTAKLVSHLRYPETKPLLVSIFERLQAAGRQLSDSALRAAGADGFNVQGKITSNFTRASYAAAFSKVQDYLHAGDCYQVNLAQRFTVAASGDALGAYLTLRKLSPAPYSAYLNFPQVKILCASPERFVSVHNGRVETKPIKGTRPRDSDPVRDAQLAAALSTHPKDRAENLMIVDLLRNDLGKNCIPGSVRVPKLFEVESFANVHHLVSTVQGELAQGRDALNMLSDCFPGGSITGAPKRRAMQIIAELEPDARSVYCGSIGYVGFDGNMDTNIAIRTLVYSRGEMACWAGGGLVADSVCEAEYQETLDKASLMLELMRFYGGSF